jgi:hypothetical protein
VDEEVWSAILALEQIVEAMPNDRSSLEALADAYQQIGDHIRAKDYLVRLGNVLVEEGDAGQARELLHKIRAYAEDDERVQELINSLESFVQEGGEGDEGGAAGKSPDRVTATTAKAVRMKFNMAEELSFAWSLMEAEQLTKEEYASIVKDLSEMSAVESDATVSVLHVLAARGGKNMERIIGHVAKTCDTPYVSLTNFALGEQPLSVLPLDFMVRRGALVFELLGNDALVVVMNPYDKELRGDVEALAERKCHFFVTLPSEFDMAVERKRNPPEEDDLAPAE